MIETVEAANSGYRFMPGVSQYSAGVAALPGFTLERVRFARPVPLRQGFERIAQILKDAGRPLTAFAACELRSPAPFTESGFVKFNEEYTGTLKAWGLMPDGVNPVARSNVCPKIDPPSEPGFHAFSYTVAAANAPGLVRRRRQRRSAGGQVELPRSRHPARRHVTCRDAREGEVGFSARWSGA